MRALQFVLPGVAVAAYAPSSCQQRRLGSAGASSDAIISKHQLTTLQADKSSGWPDTKAPSLSYSDEPRTTAPVPEPVQRRGNLAMSQAIPFLACPEPLIDCDFAGNRGFDPLGLAQNKDLLWTYREAEIKHARLAMLAAAGWPLSELYDRQIANFLGLPPVLDDTDRAPSVLNGGLEKISPVWWGFCVGLTAAIDLEGVAMSRRGVESYRPGDLGFDPLGLYPSDRRGRERMSLAEIKHGRLAMVAVVGYVFQEYFTKESVINETPVLFQPIAESM